MNAQRILNWIHSFRERHGRDPRSIPMTPVEIREALSSAEAHQYVSFAQPHPSPPTIFNCEVEETPFAQSLRNRRLDLPLIELSETVQFEPNLVDVASWEDQINKTLYRNLRAHVCGQVSALQLTLEVDPMRGLKEWIKARRWWPFKPFTMAFLTWYDRPYRVAVVVEATVLYPYLKIALPHNRHTVRFRQQQ